MGGVNSPWSSSDIAKLRANAAKGVQLLALLLGRTPKAIRRQAAKQRISLRTTGETRGIIMGQTRGVPWRDHTGADPVRLAAIRADVISGTVSMGDLERDIRERLTDNRPVCPLCGQRPQQRPTTGLCDVCHIRELARAHRDESDRREARRDLWRARQSKHRAGE